MALVIDGKKNFIKRRAIVISIGTTAMGSFSQWGREIRLNSEYNKENCEF